MHYLHYNKIEQKHTSHQVPTALDMKYVLWSVLLQRNQYILLIFKNKECKKTQQHKIQNKFIFSLYSVHQSADSDGPIDSGVSAFHKKQKQERGFDTAYQVGN